MAGAPVGAGRDARVTPPPAHRWARWPDADRTTILSLRSTDGARLLVRSEWPALDRAEFARAVTLRAPRDAARLLAIQHPRSALQSLQAATLAARSCAWAAARRRRPKLTRDARDRPQYAAGGGSPADLNLTHGAGYVAIAFDPRGPVGVDIEAPRVPTEALADETLAASELHWLDGVRDDAERARRFAQLWTLKESLAKCVGEGLRLDPRELVFSVSGRRAALLRAPVRGRWTFASFTLPGGVPCTVCRGAAVDLGRARPFRREHA